MIVFIVCQGACSSSQVEITVIRDTLSYASNELFALYDYETDENVYVSWNPTDNSLESRTICIPRVKSMIYSLLIANETDSWNACSGLEIYGPYGNRLFKRTPVGTIFVLSLVMPIEKNAVWEWTTNYNSDWFSSTVSGWDSGIPSSLPETDKTYYLRKSITEMGYVSAYEFRILYRHGVVVYMNGVEVYRDNMPDGAITPETRCSKTYGTYDYRGTIRNGFEVANAAVFAVEVHVTSSTSLQFDAWMAYYADTYSSAWPTNCYYVPVMQAVTSSYENAAIYVDGSICTGSYHTITIDSTYIEYTTQTAQVNNWNINGDETQPMSQFKVINQPLSNTTWSTTTYSAEFTMMYGILEQIPIGDYYSDSANKYRFYPIKVGTNPIVIMDLMPSVCYQEYTLTRSNPPSYKASYEGRVGDSIEVAPESSESLQCDISPALPLGLALTNCTIRGTPREAISTTNFTLFYYDRAGTRSVELSLTIAPLPEEKKMTWLVILIVVIVVIIVVVIVVLLNRNRGGVIPVKPKPNTNTDNTVDISTDQQHGPIVPPQPSKPISTDQQTGPIVPPQPPKPISTDQQTGPVVPVPVVPDPVPVPVDPIPVVPIPIDQSELRQSMMVVLPSGDLVDLFTLPQDERDRIMKEMDLA